MRRITDEQRTYLRLRAREMLQSGSYEEFEESSNEYMFGAADARRIHNNRRLGRIMLQDAARGGWAGSWRAFVIGMGAHVVGGAVSGSGGEASGSADPSANGGDSGGPGDGPETPKQTYAWLDQHDAAWKSAANEAAAGYTDGNTLYDMVQKAGGYTDAQMMERFFPNYDVAHQSALESLDAKGVEITYGGEWQATSEGVHVSGDGRQGWVVKMSADHYVISNDELAAAIENGTPPQNIMHFQGELTRPQQAALIDFEGNPDKFTVLSRDEFMRLASGSTETVMPVTANALAQAQEVINGILNNVRQALEAEFGPGAHDTSTVATAMAQHDGEAVIGVSAQDAAEAVTVTSEQVGAAMERVRGQLTAISPAHYPYIAEEIGARVEVPPGYIAEMMARVNRESLALAA